MGDYPTPPGDSLEPLVRQLKDLQRQLNDLQRPGGTNIAELKRQVKQALVDITATVISTTNTYLATGTVSVASLSASGSVSVSGPIYSPHGRANPVTSGYVSAWLNTDGRIGASASSIEFKQDIQPADTTEEVAAILSIGMIRYRYIADVEEHGENAPWHLGSLAEYMATTGLKEWVPLDQDGNPFAINWEHLVIPAIAAIQNLDARLKVLENL